LALIQRESLSLIPLFTAKLGNKTDPKIEEG